MSYRVVMDRLGAAKSFCLENATEAAQLASRLISEGRREVRVVTPEGAVYLGPAFDELIEQGNKPSAATMPNAK